MAILTYGTQDSAMGTHGVVVTSNLKATIAGHIYDVVCAASDVDNGMNIKVGKHLGNGRELREGTLPAATDKIALVASVVKIYDDSTSAKASEKNFYNPKGEPMRAYEVVEDDTFGVSQSLFTTVLQAGQLPAIDSYVLVDGKGGWKESASDPGATVNAFLGQVYGYQIGDSEKIVQIRVVRNG